MVLAIRVNTRSTTRALDELQRWAERQDRGASRDAIVRKAGEDLRDEVRRKLRTGGNGKWKGLSPWTKQRTGRTVPLSTLAPLVKVRRRRRRTEVFFDSPSAEWSLTSHHRGFNVRETRALMRIPLLSGPVFLKRRRPFSVPARPVWPTDRRVTTLLNRRIRSEIVKLQRGLLR